MKICPNCHNPVEDNTVFCVHCGASLENAAAQNQNPQQPPVNPQQPPQGPQQPPQGPQQPPRGPQQPPQGQQQYYRPPYAQPMVDPYDHTAEFDAKDISDNKVYAMAVYLLGAVGIIIALLAAGKSPYASFQVRQGLKFTIIEALATMASVFLVWTIIVPIAYVILSVALFVCKIIAFFQICGGKAVEPYIIRSLPFLK